MPSERAPTCRYRAGTFGDVADNRDFNWAMTAGSRMISFSPMPDRAQSSQEIESVTATLPDGRVLVPQKVVAEEATEPRGVDFLFDETLLDGAVVRMNGLVIYTIDSNR